VKLWVIIASKTLVNGRSPTLVKIWSMMMVKR